MPGGRDYTWRKELLSLQIMGVNTGLRIWPKDNASIGFRVRNPVDSGCCGSRIVLRPLRCRRPCA